MIKNILNIPVLMIFSLFIISCGTVKTITSDPGKMDDDALIQRINQNNLDFEYLKFDCDVKLLTESMNVEGNAEIRMKKDEYIWVVLKKFGFEIARALIRPDSFFVIDRFNRNYSSGTTDKFALTYGIPFDFKDIQNFIAGNTLLDGQEIMNRKLSEPNYQIETRGSKFNTSISIDNHFYTIFARIIDNSDKSLEAKYSDFQKAGTKQISFNRIFNFFDKSAANQVVEIKINEFVIDKEHKIKFEIPSDYEKI